MRTGLLRYGLPFAFATILLVSALDVLFDLLPKVTSIENRQLTGRPRWTAGPVDDYLHDWERYFEDHFAWRGRLQQFGTVYQRWTDGRSPLPDLVVVGSDDWFYKGGLQLAIYRGKRRFSPAELAEVTETLRERRDSVTARGGRYVLAVAPLKHHIYPGHLPDYVRPLNQDYATRQLYRELDHIGVDYVDLHAALTAYADTAGRKDLYYRSDHHWTVRAGVVAAEAIQAHLYAGGPTPTNAAPLYYEQEERPAMLLAQLAGRPELREVFYTLHRRGDWQTEEVPRPELTPPTDFVYADRYALSRQQRDTLLRQTLPDLFVTRESFGENLYLPLSECYGRSFWLFDEWQHGLNLEDYRREGGEVYVQLIWEGFLFNLLREPPVDGKW